ncbi:MAG: glycolate oxidase FAD binding subunit [Planctomycetota bacterium]|jgi:glycolate oxidase FAD binding subunit
MPELVEVDIAQVDIEAELCTQVAAVAAAGGQIEIVGSGSKRFYGEPVEALAVEVAAHSGVIDYDPAELVITLRAGCRLAEVEQLLADNGQMFAFEPPHLGEDATIGGMVASGLAGPRRAYAGSIRDYVLGVKIIDGRGQVQQFGGRVIKNVAGFDLSRLMVGSLGTLGILLEVSIRVIPVFECEVSLAFEHDELKQHLHWVNDIAGSPFPLSASTWQSVGHSGQSLIRLSGSEQGVAAATAKLGGERFDFDWSMLKEQTSAFFTETDKLTRVALPPTSKDVLADSAQLVEWGGAQRWLQGEQDLAQLRALVESHGGSVCAYRNHDDVDIFHPLKPAILKLQRSLKSSFDPAGIFNVGRIYAGL